MGLRVSGKNLDVGEAIRQQAESRIGSALAKYFEGGVKGHVTLARDGTGFRSDAVLHLSSGITLEATGQAHDAYQSVDQMVERMEKRLRRYKRRLKDRSGAAQARRPLEMASYVIEAPVHGEDEADGHEMDEHEMDGREAEAHTAAHPAIVAEQPRSLHEFSVSDAVSELDMTGAQVVVFRNAGNGRVNVVYRRPDGNIGWIDPPAALS